MKELNGHHYLGNMGDIGWLDYGGFFVFGGVGEDRPHVEVLEVPEDEEDEEAEPSKNYVVYRFDLESHTFVNGVLSDNSYHPDHPAWYADKLPNISETMDMPVEKIIRLLCSADPWDRAQAYQAIIGYWGLHEFDSYPVQFTRAEAEERFDRLTLEAK